MALTSRCRQHAHREQDPPSRPEKRWCRRSRGRYTGWMSEVSLPGGNTTGALLVGDTVHKRASPWTPTVHALLRHLEAAGFDGAPRALGFDDHGREMLTYLSGETIGETGLPGPGGRRPTRCWPRSAGGYGVCMTRPPTSSRLPTNGGSSVAPCDPG